MNFNVHDIRKEFPLIANATMPREPHQSEPQAPLVYLDNAATTQKPMSMIQALNDYYQTLNANIHRSAHALAEESTKRYEHTRDLVQKLLNTQHREEIIFTKGTTHSINMLAQSLSSQTSKQHNVVITQMEHHSNIVPWQMLTQRTGCELRVIPVNALGELNLDKAKQLIDQNTKILSVVHISNALGTINPVKELIGLAHQQGALTHLDAAQSVAHMQIDVQALDCDFLSFSAHKVYGPTGVGIWYGKKQLLEELPPVEGGGEMIHHVSFEETSYNVLPYKFEAGTPNFADVIAFSKSLDFFMDIRGPQLFEYEKSLLDYATQALNSIPKLKIIGQAHNKSCILGFVVDGIHPDDMGMLFNQMSVAIRAGHHCAQPIMQHFEVPGTARASLACYNTKEDIDRFLQVLEKSIHMLQA